MGGYPCHCFVNVPIKESYDKYFNITDAAFKIAVIILTIRPV